LIKLFGSGVPGFGSTVAGFGPFATIGSVFAAFAAATPFDTATGGAAVSSFAAATPFDTATGGAAVSSFAAATPFDTATGGAIVSTFAAAAATFAAAFDPAVSDEVIGVGLRRFHVTFDSPARTAAFCAAFSFATFVASR
jgi:hypothetical protein